MDSQIKEEVEALRRAAALFDFSFMGKIEFAGKDATDFLHRMLTSDVKKLKPGAGQESLLLDNKGKILAELKIYKLEDKFLGLTQSNLVSKILSNLEKYRFAEQLSFQDCSPVWSVLSLQGPKSQAILHHLWSQLSLPTELESHSLIKLDENEIRIVRSRGVAPDSYDLWIKASLLNLLKQKLLEVGKDFGMRQASQEAWETARIEAGIPRYGSELDETVYPQEARLDNAFSLSKGCYPGQETVARMHTYGSPPKKLVGVVFDENATISNQAAAKVLQKNGEEIGKLCSWTYSPSLGKMIGLAYVKRGEETPGMNVQTSEGLSAVLSVLPFVKN